MYDSDGRDCQGRRQRFSLFFFSTLVFQTQNKRGLSDLIFTYANTPALIFLIKESPHLSIRFHVCICLENIHREKKEEEETIQ